MVEAETLAQKGYKFCKMYELGWVAGIGFVRATIAHTIPNATAFEMAAFDELGFASMVCQRVISPHVSCDITLKDHMIRALKYVEIKPGSAEVQARPSTCRGRGHLRR